MEAGSVKYVLNTSPVAMGVLRFCLPNEIESNFDALV
jgi:hypothetical protein